MKKTRQILAVLTLALGFGHYMVATSALHAGMQVLLHIAGGVLLLAALGILVFSYMEVTQMSDGSLHFGAKNPFMRFVLARISEEVRPQRVTLCNAYWLTVMLIVTYSIMALIGTMLLSVVAGFVYAIATGKGPEMWSKAAQGGTTAALMFGAFALFFVFIVLLERVKKTKSRFYRPLSAAFAVYGLVVICGFVKALIPEATVVGALLWTLGALGILVAICVLIVAAFMFVTMLADTRLGTILGRTKDRFCPVLAVTTDDQEPYS